MIYLFSVIFIEIFSVVIKKNAYNIFQCGVLLQTVQLAEVTDASGKFPPISCKFQIKFLV